MYTTLKMSNELVINQEYGSIAPENRIKTAADK